MQEKIRELREHYGKNFLANAGDNNIMVVIIKHNRKRNEIVIEDFGKKTIEELIEEIDEKLGGQNGNKKSESK